MGALSPDRDQNLTITSENVTGVLGVASRQARRGAVTSANSPSWLTPTGRSTNPRWD